MRIKLTAASQSATWEDSRGWEGAPDLVESLQLIHERLPGDTESPPEKAARRLADRLGSVAVLKVETEKIETVPDAVP